MKKTLELTLQQAQSIYKTADASLKEILESNFGKKNLIGRPLGVWCLTKDNKAVKPEDWKEEYEALGVGVITDKTAFIVLPTPQVALPFGSTSVEEYDDIVYDKETYDSAAATDCIDEAHSGVNGKVWGSDKFPFVGAPAAEYCLKQGGYLPTLATAKEIAANIKSINEAMLAIGGYVVCGWLWTSTVKEFNICAFVVITDDGRVINEDRNDYYYARAVSAFHFENFEF